MHGGVPAGSARFRARLRVLFLVLVLVPGLALSAWHGAWVAGAVDHEQGGFQAQDFRVPGTDRLDLQATASRNWSSTPSPDPETIRFVGEARDPRVGMMAMQLFSDVAVLEAALSQPREDEPDRLEAVFNVGAVPSSIRLEPAWEPGDGADGLATIDVPRLDWTRVQWENRSLEDGRSIELVLQAPVPLPDGNGTSPPLGGSGAEADASTGLVLEWRVGLTESFSAAPSPQTPAAIRFAWRLLGEGEETFPADQSLTLRLRYDYDVSRQARRVQGGSPIGMDGAYLLSDPHRAALRLDAQYVPLTPAPGNETNRSASVQVDVYPSAGGPGPTGQPGRFPPPLIVEGVTQPLGHASRGFSLSGELAFHTLEGDDPNEPDEPRGPADDPQPPWPLAPGIWRVVFVVALALFVTVPRLRA